VGGPSARTITIELERGQIAGDASNWQVNANDEVTLVVRSDEPVNFHLHGYDLEQDVTPEEPAEFIFTANATGSFPITIHRSAVPASMSDHDASHESAIEGPAGMSVGVEATPDSVSGLNLRLTTTGFTFSPEEVGGEHVQGQGHAHVYVDGVKEGRVYGDYYHLGSVGPGEHTIRVTLNANTHAEYAVEGQLVEHSISVTVPSVEDAGHGGGADSTTVEAELGRFEVRP
ncbi:MAG: hypothetical protein OXN15_04390, partial [Chloroflexota bacterium]|nr:hypothetical protein [Chloroflexota bacterium]